MAEPEIQKGLAGVTVDTTAISKVMPETNSLTYRGYAVQDLCAHASFEEVAWLMWNGDLPTAAQLDELKAEEARRREITEDHVAVIRRFPRDAHPMDTLRTAVSYLGTAETAWGGEPEEADRNRSLDLFAKIPTMIATDYRFRKGEDRIAPRDDLPMVENFFNMCFGEVPPREVIDAFDTSMILYAEHSFNASTFTVRTIASSRSDIYSAVTGGIGSLKGPLHGGANEAVMHMFLEIGDPDIAEQWMKDAIAGKRLVMGFGHRVYKSGDSQGADDAALPGGPRRLEGRRHLDPHVRRAPEGDDRGEGDPPQSRFPGRPGLLHDGLRHRDVHAALRDEPDHRLDRPLSRAERRQPADPPAERL